MHLVLLHLDVTNKTVDLYLAVHENTVILQHVMGTGNSCICLPGNNIMLTLIERLNLDDPGRSIAIANRHR